jgi:hypothetical protein
MANAIAEQLLKRLGSLGPLDQSLHIRGLGRVTSGQRAAG